jgi:hypothetical protein
VETRFGRNPTAEMARMNEEAMLFDPEKNTFFQLNATAAVVWERLADPCTAEQLASEVKNRFEAASADVLHEVQALLQQMLNHKLVVRVD